jgi:hypothetical protein
MKIVFSSNQYYLYDDINFYGPYHSIADAMYGRHTLKRQHTINLSEVAQLIDYKVIVPSVY